MTSVYFHPALLVTHGYSDDEIKAVTGTNILRVLEQVWF